MSFYDRYELVGEIEGEGTRGFRARQKDNGREVAVHLLLGGRTPENLLLLARVDAFRNAPRLIEIGEFEGTDYVVTEAPPYVHLNEWVLMMERAAVAEAQKFNRVGTWKVTLPQPAAAKTPPAPAAPPPAQGPASALGRPPGARPQLPVRQADRPDGSPSSRPPPDRSAPRRQAPKTA